MRKVRRLACWLGIPAAIAVVLVTSSDLLQNSVKVHEKSWFILPLLFFIGKARTCSANFSESIRRAFEQMRYQPAWRGGSATPRGDRELTAETVRTCPG